MKNVINNIGKQAILFMACPLLAIASSAQDQQQENGATIKIAASIKYYEAEWKRICFAFCK